MVHISAVVVYISDSQVDIPSPDLLSHASLSDKYFKYFMHMPGGDWIRDRVGLDTWQFFLPVVTVVTHNIVIKVTLYTV